MNNQSMLVRQLGMPIYQSRGWMKVLGILMIVQGVVTVFSIVGILIAWLPIWIGVVLYQSATTMERAYLTGNPVEFEQWLITNGHNLQGLVRELTVHLQSVRSELLERK